VLPLRLACDPADLGCECDALRRRALRPTRLLLFDRCDGGNGISDRVRPLLLPLLADALRRMRDCGCQDGCPLCVHSPRCPEYNLGVDKRAAIAIAEAALEAAASATPASPPPPARAAAAASSGAALPGSVPLGVCGGCSEEEPEPEPEPEREREREPEPEPEPEREREPEPEPEPPSMLERSIARLRAHAGPLPAPRSGT